MTKYRASRAATAEHQGLFIVVGLRPSIRISVDLQPLVKEMKVSCLRKVQNEKARHHSGFGPFDSGGTSC
ncbi:hypothetical protein AGR2A_Cc30250 [Agrobacterium genomosp. 2 str. CFBP 5494]|uniref:Uncharacterized protein n=1 Tax=Agrobacterium genomosp. 2 str. CFBP 5494 TaxID=1183436 RepID=A0A9W5B1P4_9HYPH|nr:hypothetical protein AGR2A_Cc30250 [Agrobacterium genomosp. 2 str. CFBP 5494]